MERKPEEQLRRELDAAEEEMEDFVAPAGNEEREAIFEMPINELKERYSRRYQIYVDHLRRSRRQLSDSERENESRHWLGVLNSLDDYLAKYELTTSYVND